MHTESSRAFGRGDLARTILLACIAFGVSSGEGFADNATDGEHARGISGATPEVEQALDRARNNVGITLADFNVLFDWFQAEHDSRAAARFLLGIRAHDVKLAETLLLFREIAKRPAQRDNVAHAAFTHYVVHTETRLTETLSAPRPRRFAEEYGRSMVADFGKISLPQKGETSPARLRESAILMNNERYGRDDVVPTTAFEFLENAESYHKANAMWMAEFAALAYRNPNTVRGQLKRWGDQSAEITWISDPKSDTQLFVVVFDRYVVVSFRGTSSFKDVGTDLLFRRTSAHGNVGRVHRGFKQSLDRVWSKLARVMAGRNIKGKRIFVTGHSLGAALAQLAAFRIHSNETPITAVYAFGSPLVGDETFTKAYDLELASRTFLHVNHEDIVTKIPPMWLGFERAAIGTARMFTTAEGHEMAPLAPERVRTASAAGVSEGPDGSIQLTERARDDLNRQIRDANAVLDRTTRYLRTNPNEFDGGSYTADFERGAADEHGIDEYLFKLGCAIVAEMWLAENERGRE